MRFYVFCLISLLFLGACGSRPNNTDYIARVGNTELTDTDLRSILSDSYDNRIMDQSYLNSLITSWTKKEILFQKAKEFHFHDDPAIKFKVDDFYRDLTIDAYIKYHIQTNVSFTEEEIRAYYESNKRSFTRDTDEAKVSHIIIQDLDEAERVKATLRSRSSSDRERLFAQYAFETKIIRKNESLKEINNTVFSTRPRTLLGPIPSDYGYHIIEVLDRYQPGTIRPFEEVRDEIIDRITQQKIQEYYTVLVDSLIDNADYEINEDKLSKLTSELYE